ncbi:TIM-barrel domain-containing protein [Fimbriimonas ginsengisoli]|nr:TIM-barrel domain-containing protein [Fimbriimonas ginsengisoli]
MLQAVFQIERQEGSVAVQLGSQRLVIEPLTPSAIHIQVVPNGEAIPPSLVRLPVGKPPIFTVRKSANEIQVATKLMRVVLNRKSGALEFRTSGNRPFLTERAGTRLLQPATVGGVPLYKVGQTFESPPHERLFGLGQFQNGLWNWRGLPLELRQMNSQISVPVLFSSRNFGLLWENASRTDFNPAETAILLEGERQEQKGPTATEQIRRQGNPPSAAGRLVGTFTPPKTGAYAFAVRGGDRRGELTLELDGKPLNSLVNFWTTSGIEAKSVLSGGKPVTLSVRGGGKGIKLFARAIDDSTTFRSDYGHAVDYTVFHGAKPEDAIAAYREVTGKAPMFPKWAYGFWQCRERYASQKELVDTAAEFRRRQIPMDLIVQDWQYWGPHGWGSYEWDEAHYPDPKEMIDQLHKLGTRFMISVWCNPSGRAQAELKANHDWVNGWLDVFSNSGRSTRWKYIDQAFFSKGADAWWGDATEPGDPGTDWLGTTTSAGPGDVITSAYPLMASRGLYEGQRSASKDKRVCILTRSAFPGIQRYASASWSGDINSTWDAFRRQVPAGLNFSLTGIPYWTTDTGGFFRPRDQYASPDFNELLSRWFAWSAFCPILRIHGYQSHTEFWNYLPETQRVLLGFDELRYRMLPYNYSVAWQVWKNDESIMRPLGLAFPQDPRSWDEGASYLFGPSLLVSPVTEPGASTWRVYLPACPGGWINFWTGKRSHGGQDVQVASPVDMIPLFVKAGSILPLGPVIQSTGMASESPLELRVYPGANGAFTLYDDAGDGYGYESGAHSEIPITWREASHTLTLGARKGTFFGMKRTIKLRVVMASEANAIGPRESTGGKTVNYSGQPLILKL